MESPFSLPLIGFWNWHVTHFWPVRPEKESVGGGVWVGEGRWKRMLMRKFLLLLRKPERNDDITPFSLFCMDAQTGTNSDIASILMMNPAWRMAGGRDGKKLGPDDVTELQCQAILTQQSYCVRSHNCATQYEWEMFCYLDIESPVMSIT